MENESDRIDQLMQRMELLFRRQDSFYKEIYQLRQDIIHLKENQPKEKIEPEPSFQKKEMISEEAIEEPVAPLFSEIKLPQSSVMKAGTEKFIGENLINKVGILITVIGAVIGAKYSIEHQLISPLGRILLGYFLGLGLLGFGIKLKKNYRNYSAVLVSGAIAILYFITYSAYTFYNLIPQPLAFGMMVLFTISGVVASLSYDLPVIAHIGLVGAYAVPFMVGGDSGNALILFSYIAIINIGILFLASKKYWKSLYYSSFVFTWLIFGSWYNSKNVVEHSELVWIFISIFFITFYLIFLDYKLIRKEKFNTDDIILLLANTFIFYAFGYSNLKSTEAGEQWLGAFTLLNGAIHFMVALVISRQKLADRDLFYFVAGLVLVFITIAIPVALNGNWVTLLWTGEATLLFWIGRSRKDWTYEKLSYLLMILSFISLIQDWMFIYSQYDPKIPASRINPILNIHFLTSVLFVISFGFINYVYQKYAWVLSSYRSRDLQSFMDFSIPAIFLIAAYTSFAVEISNYWNQLYTDSFMEITKDGQTITHWNRDLLLLKSIWIINYSLAFLCFFQLIVIKRIKNYNLGLTGIILSGLMIFIFLTMGLYAFSELRQTFLSENLHTYYPPDSFHIIIRYISYVFAGALLYVLYKMIQSEFIKQRQVQLQRPFEIMLSISLIWIASSEWINVMDLLQFTQSYRLGLSILWGLSSLILVILGIWKQKSHLRIVAIVLFAITLLKLFIYDISHLSAIGKTIVFVSLGILLLIISFLYNRYKHLIYSEI